VLSDRSNGALNSGRPNLPPQLHGALFSRAPRFTLGWRYLVGASVLAWSAPVASQSPADFVDTWVNVHQDTRGLTRIIITAAEEGGQARGRGLRRGAECA
jgi:hypothetical protein